MKAPVQYYKTFVPNPDDAFKRLQAELDWERRDTTPRSEYYCNDIVQPYIYGTGRGRRTYYVKPWHPVIMDIRLQLEELVKSRFEVCFLNRYLNQSDQLGWHADDSPEMDDARPIASVSLGVEREIWFKANGAGAEEVERLKLEHGSLCLMAPGMQDTHKHRIPKASFTCGERISLTFRGYVQ